MATCHVPFLKRWQKFDLRLRPCQIDDGLCQVYDRIVCVVTDIDNVIHHEIILQYFLDAQSIVVYIAECPRLRTATINRNGFVLQSGTNEFRDNEVGTLLWPVGIE